MKKVKKNPKGRRNRIYPPQLSFKISFKKSRPKRQRPNWLKEKSILILLINLFLFINASFWGGCFGIFQIFIFNKLFMIDKGVFVLIASFTNMAFFAPIPCFILELILEWYFGEDIDFNDLAYQGKILTFVFTFTACIHTFLGISARYRRVAPALLSQGTEVVLDGLLCYGFYILIAYLYYLLCNYILKRLVGKDLVIKR